MAQVEISANSVFVGHSPTQHHGVGWSWWHAPQYHTSVILGGADFKDTVAVAYSALLGRDSALCGTDEREGPADVIVKANQAFTSCFRNSDPGYPALGSSNVLVQDDQTSHWTHW